jgi:hypothetical protein
MGYFGRKIDDTEGIAFIGVKSNISNIFSGILLKGTWQ